MLKLLNKFFGPLPKMVTLYFFRVPSLSIFGSTAAIVGVYFTEWRVISDYIPFYNGKFKDEAQ